MFLPYINYINKKKIYNTQNDMEETINIRGKWDSNFGEMVMIQKGNQVTGYYYWEDGIITGTMDGKSLIADWIQLQSIPPRDYGKTILNFTSTTFDGKYSYREEPMYYIWYGKKISSIFQNNCNRYHVINNISDNIIINNEIELSYEQVSVYIYPEECVSYVDLEITIDEETTRRRMEVQLGFSYLFSIEGTKDNIIINSTIENPFYK